MSNFRMKVIHAEDNSYLCINSFASHFHFFKMDFLLIRENVNQMQGRTLYIAMKVSFHPILARLIFKN